MRQPSPHRRIRNAVERIKRFFKREPDSPDDPYALVGAPKKPRPPLKSAAVEAHAALLKASNKWDTVMMPVHAADHAYLSFEKTALPVAREFGLGVQAIKVFGKAFLLRSLSPTECLKYVLSQPGVHVAICGAGTQGQMEDNIRTVQNFRKMTPEEIADVRKRAIAGSGVYTGPTLEYWKKKA